MTGLIIRANKKRDLKLFTELTNRLGISSTLLSDEEILDIGLLKAIEEGQNSKIVSKEIIMKKLKKIEPKVS